MTLQSKCTQYKSMLTYVFSMFFVHSLMKHETTLLYCMYILLYTVYLDCKHFKHKQRISIVQMITKFIPLRTFFERILEQGDKSNRKIEKTKEYWHRATVRENHQPCSAKIPKFVRRFRKRAKLT